MSYDYCPGGITDIPPTCNADDLAVITCHFNWQGYKRPRQNLKRFLRHMASRRIAVYGVEAVLPGQVAQTVGMSGWAQVPANNHCLSFQKEALLNLAEQLVPERYTKLAWVDPDLHFTCPQWAQLTSALLDHAAVVQPFYHATWTNEEGEPESHRPSVAWSRCINPLIGHPGFAVAARRSMFRACGLWDGSISGQGDAHFMRAVTGDALTPHSLAGLGGNPGPYYRWRDKFRAWYAAEGGMMLAARGDVVHEWHGDRAGRNYRGRHTAIANFDLDKHAVKNASGLWQWRDTCHPKIMADVAQYFAERREDG